ncbi:hypothetical protein FRC00_002415, partial [Tulasnella sp. 408]
AAQAFELLSAYFGQVSSPEDVTGDDGKAALTSTNTTGGAGRADSFIGQVTARWAGGGPSRLNEGAKNDDR